MLPPILTKAPETTKLQKQMAVCNRKQTNGSRSAIRASLRVSSNTSEKNSFSISHICRWSGSQNGGSRQGSVDSVAKGVWDFGKKLEMATKGEEKAVVNLLRGLEERDRGNIGGKQL